MIKLKRAYEEAAESDGIRILVDRIWPRGKSKEEMDLDDWIKELAPSTELRKWFDHDPDKWEEFQSRYVNELKEKENLWEPLLTKAEQETVTFICSVKDQDHNNAVVLRDFLEQKMQ